MIDAHRRTVGRHDDRRHAVEFVKLFGRAGGRRGHAGELGVAGQEVLQRGAAEDRPLGTPGDPLLDLDGGLQAVREVPVRHHAPRELVDQFDAIAADDVVDVAMQQHPGVQRAVDLRQQLEILGFDQVAALQSPLQTLVAALGEIDVPPVLVGRVVLA